MKKIFTILSFVFAFVQLQAQTLNQLIIDPDIDKEVLIGLTDEQGLMNPIFIDNWQDSYDNYILDKKATKKLKKFVKKNKDLSIKVFFASWCGDSQEHLPNFVKLVHKIKLQNVSYYGLNRKIEMGDFDFIDVYSFNIEKVPTFIIYNGDVEIGRIIETPTNSLEKDIYEIVKSL